MAAPVELFVRTRLRFTPTPTFAPIRTLRQTPKISRRPPDELVSIRTTPPYLISTSTNIISTATFTSVSSITSQTTPIFTPPFVIPTSDVSVNETSTSAISLTTPIFTPPFVIPTSPSTTSDVLGTESSTRTFTQPITSASSSITFERSNTETSTSNQPTTLKQETSEVVRVETSKEPLSQSMSTSASPAVSISSTTFPGSSDFTNTTEFTGRVNLTESRTTLLMPRTEIISNSTLTLETNTDTNSTSVFQATTTSKSTKDRNIGSTTSVSRKSEASSIIPRTDVSTPSVSRIATSSSKDPYVSTFDWLEVTDFSTNGSSSRTDAVATSSRNTTQAEQILTASPMWLYGLIFSLIFISLLLLTLLLTVLWRAYLRHYWSAFIDRYCCVECCPSNKPVTSSNQVLRGFSHYLVDPMAVGHPNWIVQKTPDNQSLITMSNGRPIKVRDSEGEKLLETSNPQYRTVIKIPGSITYQRANHAEVAMVEAQSNVSSISNFSSRHAGAVTAKPVSFNNIGFQNNISGTANQFPVSYYPFANYPANLYFSRNPGYLMTDNYPYNPMYLADNRTPSAPGHSVQKRVFSGRKARRIYPSLTTPESVERPPTYSAIINAFDVDSTLDAPDSGRKGRGGGVFRRMFGRTAARRPSYLDIQEESLLVDEDTPDHSRLLNRNNNSIGNNGNVVSNSNNSNNNNNSSNNNNSVRLMAVSSDPRSLVLLNKNTEGLIENSLEDSRKKPSTSEGVTEFRISDVSGVDSNDMNSTRKISGLNLAVNRGKTGKHNQQTIELVERIDPSQTRAVMEIPLKQPAHSIRRESSNNNNNNSNNNNNDITGFQVKKSTARNTCQNIVVLDRSNHRISVTTEEFLRPVYGETVDAKNKDSKRQECVNKEMVPLMTWGNDLAEAAEQSQSMPQTIVQPGVQPTTEVQPVTQPLIQPLNKPITKSIIQPNSQGMDQSVVQPVAKSVVIPIVQPTVQLKAQPTAHSTVQSTVHSTVQPTVHSTVQPTVHSTVQPTVQPTVQSITSNKAMKELDDTLRTELERTNDQRAVVVVE